TTNTKASAEATVALHALVCGCTGASWEGEPGSSRKGSASSARSTVKGVNTPSRTARPVTQEAIEGPGLVGRVLAERTIRRGMGVPPQFFEGEWAGAGRGAPV